MSVDRQGSELTYVRVSFVFLSVLRWGSSLGTFSNALIRTAKEEIEGSSLSQGRFRNCIGARYTRRQTRNSEWYSHKF